MEGEKEAEEERKRGRVGGGKKGGVPLSTLLREECIFPHSVRVPPLCFRSLPRRRTYRDPCPSSEGDV